MGIKKFVNKAVGQINETASSVPGASYVGSLTQPFTNAGYQIGGPLGGLFAGTNPALGYAGLANTPSQVKAQQTANYARNLASYGASLAPTYSTILTPDMRLPAQYQVAANPAALNKLQGEALSSDLSPWASMQMGDINQNYGNMLGNLGQQAQSAAQEAKQSLARTTGFNPAMASTIDQGIGRQKLLSQQGIAREAAQARMGVKLSDLANKENVLQQLPNLQLQALQPQQFNIQQTLAEKAAQEQASLDKYRSQMELFGRGETAAAMAGSGKK